MKQKYLIILVIAAIIVALYFIYQKNKTRIESSWKPDVRDVRKELKSVQGISLSSIGTFGTPIT
jgi:O-antigen/teichoic acid export membrane protein